MAWEFDILFALQELHNPVLDAIMIFITSLGNGGMFWIGVGIVCLVVKKYRKMGFEVLLSMLFTYIIGNLILKNLFARQRPCVEYADLLIIPYPSEYSFPSGHSMNAMTAATAIFLCNKKLGIAAIILAVLIGFSRLYHFVHFPTDVLGGFLVGFVVAIIVNFVYEKVEARRQK